VDSACAAFVSSLRAGAPDREALARAGEPAPDRATRAFARALEDPGLAAGCEAWAPACLLGARPGFAVESLGELARLYAVRRGVSLPAPLHAPAARVLAASNFLARLLLREPEYADELASASTAMSPGGGFPELRQAKYRGLIRIVAGDLAGEPFEETLRELSELADRCLDAALEHAVQETGVGAAALLALGKLGGRELNLASDVDVLFLYESRDGAPDYERHRAVERLVRFFKARLEESGPEGFGYRVDLDLRPEGKTGLLSNSVAAALDYYERFGADWERQMLMRLRPVAGPSGVSEEFVRGIEPFVYRRSVGPEALRGVRAMKLRIEDERRAQRRDLEADLKEGPGGIRDVEFLVQALQLFYAGQTPSLRTGNVLEAIAAFEQAGILKAETARALSDAYRWLRRAEHAVQLAEERQTHSFPRDPAEQGRLARRMGYADADGARARARLLEDWTAVRTEVRAHFDELVLGEDA